MLIIASSYAGFMLLLQVPLSVLATLVALACAFSERTRRISTASAMIAVAVTLAALAIECAGYGLYRTLEMLDGPGNRGFLGLLFVPVIVSLGIIAINRKLSR